MGRFADLHLVALPCKILCQKQFNAYCGCLYSTHPNNSTIDGFPNQRFYETSVSYPLRTEDEVISDMYEADRLDADGQLGRGSVNGFLGLSVLLILKKLLKVYPCIPFNIVWSTVIDYMHCVLEGIMDDLLTLFQRLLGADKLSVFNDRISKIKLPQAMTRRPRPLSEKVHYKAKEFRALLLYFVLPCLEDLLPSENFANLKLLVNSMHILLNEKITSRSLSEAKRELHEFVRGFQRLYGLANVTYNLHLPTHLCDLVSWMGPLWCYSNFVFESGNGRLIKLIKGTRSVVNELAIKFTKLQSVPKIINENAISLTTLTFCNNVIGFKNLKKDQEIDGVCVTGSYSEVEVSDTELVLLLENHIVVRDENKVKFYHRVIYQGQMFYSHSYSANLLFDDTCVMLADGQFVIIDKIFITSSKQEVVCLVKPIRFSGNIIFPIMRCTFDCFGDPFIVSVKDVVKKCVFISVGLKKYVCRIPNHYERD